MAKKVKPEPEPTRRRKWPWLLLILLAVFWFAPYLVMHSPMKRMVLDYANPGINADIDVASSEIGWLSPVVLRGVRVRDRDGSIVAEAEAVASERTLWNLATDSANLGVFTVKNVQAKLEADSKGSNLEEIIAPLFEGPSSTTRYKYRIDIAEGAVLMSNSDTGRTSQFTNVRGFVQNTELGNGYPEISIEMQGHPDETTDSGGDLEATLTWTPASEQHPIQGNARVRGANVSLLTFGPAINRFVQDVYVDGRMKCDFAVDWSDDFTVPVFRFRGGLAVDGVRLAAPDYIGSDQLAVDTVQVAGNMDVTGSSWAFDDLHARTDFADIRGEGAVTFVNGKPTPSAESPVTVAGKIDVAELANHIPNTLRLQDGTKLTEGVANVSLTTQQAPGGWLASAEVKTNSVKGTRDGQVIAWDDPLTLKTRIRSQSDRITFERVTAESEFLTVAGAGTLDDATVQGRCDLDKLKSRLDQFVDTSDLELSGIVDVKANINRDASGVFAAKANVVARNFGLRTNRDQPAWREPRLDLNAAATGRTQAQSVQEVNSLSVNLTSGTDTLTAKLLEPVVVTGNDLVLPLDVRLKGALETWLPRLKPIADLPTDGTSGSIDLNSNLSVAADVLVVRSTNVNLRSLQLPLSDDITIVEPQLNLSGDGKIDLGKSIATFPQFKVQATSFGAAGSDVLVKFGDKLEAAAKCAVVADLQRVSAWKRSTAGGDAMTGKARGDIVVATRDGIITAQVDASLRESNLLSMLEAQPVRIAQNPTAAARPIANPANFSGVLTYDQNADILKVQKARLDSDALSLQVGGTVAQLTTNQSTDVSGSVAYDFEHLNSLLRSSFGDHIRLKGKGSHPFAIRGPLSGELNQLAGAGKITWEAASVYGLECGPGTIDAKVEGGIVRTEPVTFTLNGGNATLLPSVDLRTTPTLHLARGTQIKNVELTQEVTAEWMKFVAPLLADSARIQGRFSTYVQAVSVPLADPTNGDIPGLLQIHSAQAEPGPIVAQLVGIVNQVRQIIGRKARPTNALRATVPEQNLSFRMVQQRVHHKDFVLEIDGVKVQTSGSVGLDQSLQLSADLTLPEKWLGSGAIGNALRARPLRIPISGTLKRPRLDPSILRTLGRQAAGDAANDLLKKNLDRGLNKFFDKIK